MTALRELLGRRYRELFDDPVNAAFFGGSGYANYGLWDASTRDARAACDRLVDTLLGGLPRRGGVLLDVACGLGGTTSRAGGAGFDVVGLDIGLPQVQATRRRARAPVLRADAARLPFAPSCFDAMLCVEAAFHFETRREFLRDAHRTLVPGGGIALADVLAVEGARRIPATNFVASLEEYGESLRAAGFEQVEVRDERDASWHAFKHHYARFVLTRLWRPLVLRRLPALVRLACTRYRATDRAIRGYVLAWGRKPMAS